MILQIYQGTRSTAVNAKGNIATHYTLDLSMQIQDECTWSSEEQDTQPCRSAQSIPTNGLQFALTPMSILPPRLQSLRVWAPQTQGLHDLVPERSLPVPPVSLTPAHKPSAKPARELPAKAQARPPQRRAGLGGRGALRAPPARAARSSPLPSLGRRLPHRVPKAGGWRKPEEGGAGTISLDLSLPLAPARGSGGGRSGSGSPTSARPRRAGPGRGHDSQRLRGAPQEAPPDSTAGATTAVAEAAPQRGAMQREELRGSPSPPRGGEAQPLPFPRGGHQPCALAGRQGQENHCGAGLQEGGFRTRTGDWIAGPFFIHYWSHTCDAFASNLLSR
ncbi:proline-rich protein 18-like [Dipodomys merriami]|uniref:proline-rich protein 18-like n=1 Tax=Dipodomys merriami TaxID=94247 RepID=UPI003855FC17